MTQIDVKTVLAQSPIIRPSVYAGASVQITVKAKADLGKIEEFMEPMERNYWKVRTGTKAITASVFIGKTGETVRMYGDFLIEDLETLVEDIGADAVQICMP